MSDANNLFTTIRQTADPYGIESELLSLPIWKAAAFCAACAERLLPNYAAFERSEAWGGSLELRLLLDELWDCLVSENCQVNALAAKTKRIEDLSPQVEDFKYAWTPEALDAALSVYFGYACLCDDDSRPAVDASRGAFYTIEHYLTMQAFFEGKDVPPEIGVYSTKLWGDEVDAQRWAVMTLQQMTSPSNENFYALRQACWRNGMSNIGFYWTDGGAKS